MAERIAEKLIDVIQVPGSGWYVRLGGQYRMAEIGVYRTKKASHVARDFTRKELAALIAAEMEERDREARKAFGDLIDVAYRICRYERYPPEDGSRLNPGDLLMLYLPKAKEALALLEGGDDEDGSD